MDHLERSIAARGQAASAARHFELNPDTLSESGATPLAERRQKPRDDAHGELSRTQIVARIVGTYAEMPGLSLYPQQAARLFGLHDATCRVVLADLARSGALRRSPDGQYRADSPR